MKIIIRNAEPEGCNTQLSAVVVSATSANGPEETRHLVAPGQELTLELGEDQFVMLDDKEP